MTAASATSQIDHILTPWRETLGADFTGYRNHVCRMVQCCLALAECDAVTQQKIVIAGCFHDIGIWVADTLDYLPPSLPPMQQWLQDNGHAEWYEEIALMITEHHKLSVYRGPYAPWVELFRRGDLVDFSLGLVRFGLPRLFLKQLKTEFPNAGFHAMLSRRALKWFIRHPLNPAPMMKR